MLVQSQVEVCTGGNWSTLPSQINRNISSGKDLKKGEELFLTKTENACHSETVTGVTTEDPLRERLCLRERVRHQEEGGPGAGQQGRSRRQAARKARPSPGLASPWGHVRSAWRTPCPPLCVSRLRLNRLVVPENNVEAKREQHPLVTLTAGRRLATLQLPLEDSTGFSTRASELCLSPAGVVFPRLRGLYLDSRCP